jgi:plasmid maintenance system antidote protein VapI
LSQLDLPRKPRYIAGMARGTDKTGRADLGQAIVFIAQRLNLNQKTLAGALQIDPKKITGWKNGVGLTTEVLDKLPGVLGCTKQDMLEVAAFYANWRVRMQSWARGPVGASLDADKQPSQGQGQPDSIYEVTGAGGGNPYHDEIGRKVLDLVALVRRASQGR